MKRKMLSVILLAGTLLCSCGGGKGGDSSVPASSQSSVEPYAPVFNKDSDVTGINMDTNLLPYVEFGGQESDLVFAVITGEATIVDGHFVRSTNVGKSTVEVKYGTKTDSMEFEFVQDLYPTSISMSMGALSLIEGSNKKLVATPNPTTAYYNELTWSSTDEKVATVDQDGKVSAIAAGTCRILAKAKNEITGTCNVVVSPSISDFPSLTSFATATAYSSQVPSKYQYQAKVDGDMIYIYMSQNVTEVISSLKGSEVNTTDTHVEINLFDSTLKGDNPLNIKAYTTGTLTVGDESKFASAKCSVNATKTAVSYYITLKAKTALELPRMKFFACDPKFGKKAYYSGENVTYIDKAFLHTHAGNGWYVGKKIGFKPESLYMIGKEQGITCPEKWGFAVDAELEGAYIYAWQNVDYIAEPDEDKRWQVSPHIEFSIFQHNIGAGAKWGFNVDTYIGLWAEGDPYINYQDNIIAYDLETQIFAGKIEYRFFLRFDNNLDNPADGPYMMVKGRAYDPAYGKMPYSNDDIVYCRDERYLHESKGSSLWFDKDGFKQIQPINETTTWRDNKIKLFKDNGLENSNDLSLFIGDSYFEPENWWTGFYGNDFKDKAAASSAIGGTMVTQWLNWIEPLVKPFDAHMKNIVVHLGYNDINQGALTAMEIEYHIERLCDLLHAAYPSAEIYWLGCGVSYYFSTEAVKGQKAAALDVLTKAYCESKAYLHFASMDAAKDAAMEAEHCTFEGFYKDGTHPKDEYYKYIVAEIEKAGCVFAAK